MKKGLEKDDKDNQMYKTIICISKKHTTRSLDKKENIRIYGRKFTK